jgi:hypothetical protein
MRWLVATFLVTLGVSSAGAQPAREQTEAESTAKEPSAPEPGPIILFLIDNSASLPPLDPLEKRVVALEKMFTFLEGQPYRLVLFGGRDEVYVDEPSRYRNDGQWTDFYFAFLKAQELVKSYRPGTDFRIVLLTDGIIDPNSRDWPESNATSKDELRAYVVEKLMDLIAQMKLPLYVILVGEPTSDGATRGDRELTPNLIWDMVRAANGVRASPMAQKLSSFLKDDGLLLRKFIFRIEPEQGLKQVEPVVRRIVAPPSAQVELFLSSLVLPLVLVAFLLLGVSVRSFPGPGDVEILELKTGHPAHLSVDHMHRLESGGWGVRGLSLVGDARAATASITYVLPPLDVTVAGIDTTGLDPLTLKLLPMSLEQLKLALDEYMERGSKDEKVFALNLDYMAKNFDPALAERILTSSSTERRRTSPLDFLRAKAHLLSNSDLHKKLTEAKLTFNSYGRDAGRADLKVGTKLRIGPYGFIVRDIVRGGRKDLRVHLHYDRVPSLLGLKAILPKPLQRVIRLRRRNARVVS